MTHPELSIVIVSFRCADHLARCLDSLDRGSENVAFEVIVVDNASDDGTAAVAHKRPGTRVLDQSQNEGFATAANRGMAAACADVILVLNPDTIVPRGALRACLGALAADPAVGVLTPRIVDSRGELDPRCHRSFPTAWSAACFATGLDRRLPWKGAQTYLMRFLPDDEMADVDAVSGAFMLMRASALHQVGGFDQQFFMYAEDIDLCMRLRRAGWTVRYWPGAEVVHAGGGSGHAGRRTPKADVAAFRTMAPLIRKHRQGIRGFVLASVAAVTGEAMLGISRLRRFAGL